MSLRRQKTIDEPRGLLDWFHVLRAISDEDLKLISGADAALYVIFNRYAAIFFLAMSLFNCAVLMPLYGTGDPSRQELVQDPETQQVITLLLITALNATGDTAKMVGAFVLVLGLYSAGTLAFMFLYWKRSLAWRFKELPQSASFREGDVALHCVRVAGVPGAASVAVATERVKAIFERMFSAEKVVSVRVLPKVEDLYAKALKVREHKSKLAFYEHQNKQGGERTTIITGKRCCFGGTQVDAAEFHRAKIAKLCSSIQGGADLRVNSNSGVAFVTFVSRLQVSRCLDRDDFKELAIEKLTVEDRVKWMALRWNITPAPSESEILWENFFKSDRSSRVKSYLLLALLLFVCIVLVTPMILV